MEEKQKNYQSLKEISLSAGMSLFGVAKIDKELSSTFHFPSQEITKDLPYGICIGFRLSKKVMDSLIDRPTRLYLFHYRLVNALLDQTALKLCSFIQSQGGNALPIPASQIIDWKQNLGAVSHKLIGFYAGLGFRGRNNLLVNPTYGSQVRYASILTDFPLVTDKPIKGDCGDCYACLSSCPVGAIVEKPEDFKKELCVNQVKLFSKKENLGHQICGLCVKACPPKKIRKLKEKNG